MLKKRPTGDLFGLWGQLVLAGTALQLPDLENSLDTVSLNCSRRVYTFINNEIYLCLKSYPE